MALCRMVSLEAQDYSPKILSHTARRTTSGMPVVTPPQHGKELRNDRQKNGAMPLNGLRPVYGASLSHKEQKVNMTERRYSVKRIVENGYRLDRSELDQKPDSVCSMRINSGSVTFKHLGVLLHFVCALMRSHALPVPKNCLPGQVKSRPWRL
jgi:hypothetical protein